MSKRSCRSFVVHLLWTFDGHCCCCYYFFFFYGLVFGHLYKPVCNEARQSCYCWFRLSSVSVTHTVLVSHQLKFVHESKHIVPQLICNSAGFSPTHKSNFGCRKKLPNTTRYVKRHTPAPRMERSCTSVTGLTPLGQVNIFLHLT